MKTPTTTTAAGEMTTPMEPNDGGLRGGGGGDVYSVGAGGGSASPTSTFLSPPSVDVTPATVLANRTTTVVSPVVSRTGRSSRSRSRVSGSRIEAHTTSLAGESTEAAGTQAVGVAMTPPQVTTATRSRSSALYSAAIDLRSDQRSEENSDMTSLLQAPDRSPRPDEPNVYDVPQDLSLSYRPVPALIRTVIVLTSILLSSVLQARHLRLFESSADLAHTLKRLLLKNSLTNLLKLFFQALVIGQLSSLIVEDAFFSPSRISTAALSGKGWLPSKLSRLHTVRTMANAGVGSSVTAKGEKVGPLSVHYLEYDTPIARPNFDVIYFNHGFGASSLSWLPAIPSIVQRLGGRKGLAHDAPGFGFTERLASPSLAPYSSAGSAAIGQSILMDKAPSPSSVALFGHSMGCAATLRMALNLPPHIRKFVCLTAPALVKQGTNSGTSSEQVSQSVEELVEKQPSRLRQPVSRTISAIRTVILDAPLKWILKRACAKESFWRKGLSAAWGDPNLLSDSDVLRFRWPSIGWKWEYGILAFVRSRIRSTLAYPEGELELLRKVLEAPNTKVVIFSGTKDKIVPYKDMLELERTFEAQGLRVVPLEGQGHDPFEEDTAVFVDKVTEELEQNGF